VSLIKAHETSVYHIRGEAKYDSPPITIKEGQLRYWFDNLQSGMQRLEETFANHPQVRFTYEELFGDTQGTMDSITQFLGVKPASMNCNTMKQESRSMKDAIANYANLEKKFRDTEYHRFFES
jgi:Stf0 sulphotransferase.